MHMQQAALMAPQQWKSIRLHQTEQWLLAATSEDVHVCTFIFTSVEVFQRTDVDSTDYDLLLVEPRSVQRSHNCVGTTRTSIC